MLHELMTTAGHTLGALALGTVLPTDEGPGETRANFTLGDLNVDLTEPSSIPPTQRHGTSRDTSLTLNWLSHSTVD
jgi:hypothetical protein